jgi:hypothetical protein
MNKIEFLDLSIPKVNASSISTSYELWTHLGIGSPKTIRKSHHYFSYWIAEKKKQGIFIKIYLRAGNIGPKIEMNMG